jgi:hypothetical protein
MCESIEKKCEKQGMIFPFRCIVPVTERLERFARPKLRLPGSLSVFRTTKAEAAGQTQLTTTQI